MIAFVGIVGVVIFASAVLNILTNDNESRYMDSLNQSRKVLEQQLESMDQITNQMFADKNVTYYFAKDVFSANQNGMGPYSAQTIVNFLSAHKPPGLIADNVFLFAKHSLCFNSSSVFRMPDDYGAAFEIEGVTWTDFSQKFLTKGSYRVLVPDMVVKDYETKKNSIIYISTYPLGSVSNINGAVMYTLNTDEILNLLSGDNKTKGSYYYLFSEDGELLASSENAPLIDYKEKDTIINKEKYLIYSTNEGSARLKLVAAVPYNSLLSKISFLGKIIFGIVLLFLLLLFYCCIRFAKFNFKPIKSISDKLEDYSDDTVITDEYARISNAVNRLIKNDKELRKSIENVMPLLQSTLTKSILQGEISSEEEIKDKLKSLNVEFSGDCYMVMLISVDGIDSVSKSEVETLYGIKAVLQMLFKTAFKCLSTDLDEKTCAYVITFKEGLEGNEILEVEQKINSIGQAISEQFNCKISAAPGTVENELKKIFFSYYAAKELFELGIPTATDNVIWLSRNVSASNDGYYYPIELEMRLINSFGAHQTETVYNILDILDEQNTKNRILPREEAMLLLNNIRNTVKRLLEPMSLNKSQETMVKQMMAPLSGSLVTEETFTSIKKLFKELFELKEEKPDSDIATQMLSYVRENYKDPNFGRYNLAHRFNIVEEYVSSYFKSKTGYQFSDYLEKTRIEAACDLLKGDKLSVETISNMCGYNSSTSFRRAFKRYMQLSPSEYVNSCKKV